MIKNNNKDKCKEYIRKLIEYGKLPIFIHCNSNEHSKNDKISLLENIVKSSDNQYSIKPIDSIVNSKKATIELLIKSIEYINEKSKSIIVIDALSDINGKEMQRFLSEIIDHKKCIIIIFMCSSYFHKLNINTLGLGFNITVPDTVINSMLNEQKDQENELYVKMKKIILTNKLYCDLENMSKVDKGKIKWFLLYLSNEIVGKIINSNNQHRKLIEKLRSLNILIKKINTQIEYMCSTEKCLIMINQYMS